MKKINDIYDVYVEHFGVPSKMNTNYINCPICGANSKRKTLGVSFEKNAYHCCKCGTSGGILKFLLLMNKIDPTNMSRDEINSHVKSLSYNFVSEKNKIQEYKNVEEKPLDRKRINKANKILFNLFDDLTNEQIEHLRKRGLIDLSLYKNFSRNLRFSGANIPVDLFKGIAGFATEEDNSVYTAVNHYGIIIPYVDINGNLMSFQIRTKYKNCKYLSFSSSSHKNGTAAISFYSIIGEIKGDTMIITEGALKADASYQLMMQLGLNQTPFVAIAGVNSTKTFIKDLDEFKRKGINKFIIAFDMDKFDNIHVSNAEKKLIRELKENGFEVSSMTWDRNFKGIDDYLLHIFKKKLKNVK